MHRSRTIRNIRLGIRNLLLNKTRSMLTMLGVVFGVASVIAMLAVGEGASKEALEQIRRLGSSSIMVNSVKPVKEETGQHSFMSMYGLMYKDEEMIREVFPNVRRIVPAKIIRAECRLGSQSLEVRMVGTTPDWFTMVRREMLAGRKLTQRDEEENSGVVVLTEYGARRLMAARSTVGSDIRLNGQYFRVVGIVRSEGNLGAAIQTPDEDVDAYVPLSSARERFGDIFSKRSSGTFIRERVELHQLIIEVDETGNVEKVAAGLERALSTTHTDADYRISVPLTLLRQAEATKRTFNIVLGAIAGISLLVGGVGIMNIMLASVTERTREIGVRRAIGAKRRQIVGQFLVETVVLSTLGGAVGLGLGLLLPWAVTRIAGMPTVITWWSLILSLGISMTVGMVFGIYPAVRAANLDPIMALRHE